MTRKTPSTFYRKEYTPPRYLTIAIGLTFELNQDDAVVTARSSFQRNPDCLSGGNVLFLNGQELELMSISLDSDPLASSEYTVTDAGLILHDVPDAFDLEIVTRIFPDRNTALDGLYRSSGNFCTQCEAEGFRKITFYQDRPDVMARFSTCIEADVMARFSTCIEADRKACPVLLSNGNLVEQGGLEGGRHYAVWQDPFPKPCYLFALVAGDLLCQEDTYTTSSGRSILLQIFVQAQNLKKCDHAMHSLIKAMRWDEEVFGLEYDPVYGCGRR